MRHHVFRYRHMLWPLLALAVIALAAGCRGVRRSAQLAQPEVGPPPAVSAQRCPIDGQPIADELRTQRPLAVMVENSPKARPQSGLNDACVVYEAITEGGITRFLAIFYHGAPAIIGPVRSARPHFIHLAQEYEGIYTHCGQSQEALEYLLSTPQVYDLDQLRHDKPFWRDRTRRAPHNLYASADQLRDFARRQQWLGYPLRPPTFVSPRTLQTGAPAEAVTIHFGGAVKYTLQFVYDAQRGGYVRYMDGKLHCDRETEEPVVAHNILIQRVRAAEYPGSKYQTYDVAVIGSGDGHFVTNGRYIPMYWDKHYAMDVTRYRDAQGDALPYQRGQTWIVVVPTQGSVSFSASSAGP